MNGNMNLGKRVTLLEKGGGSNIKEEIEKLNNEVETIKTEISKGQLYNTYEKVVGTWTDGKPIYQITLHGTSTQGQYNIDVSGLSIEHIVDYNLNEMKNTNSGESVFDAYYGSSDDFLRLYYKNETKNIIFVSGLKWSYGEYNLTIMYTKSTDNQTT